MEGGGDRERKKGGLSGREEDGQHKHETVA